MSDAESDSPEGESPSDNVPFTEHDSEPTTLGYDNGGVPLFIAAAWVLFICTYVGVMSVLSLPDLLEWIAR